MFGRKPKKTDQAKTLGKWGEEYARLYLCKQGYKYLTGNFLCSSGEIDLIMVAPDKSLVFIEVKTRSNEGFVPVESVITYHKKIRLIRAARFFLNTHSIKDRPLRFDVIIIVHKNRANQQIRHYTNVFVP
jgi:putative endonuclease